MPRCACLPFCFWRGTRSRRTESRGADEAAPGKRHRRRMRRRFWLSWLAFAWLWLRRSGRKHDAGAKTTTGKQRRGGQRRLLLLNKTSLLASVVVSGDSCGLLPATVSRGFADAKKQSQNKPRPTADGSRRQPQASTTVMLGTRESTAPARPGTSQPCTTATADERALAAAGRIWRAPSRRHDSLQRPCGGLWTAATTLGVLFGRVTALVFMCSCLYGARFVRLRLTGAGASAKTSGGVARAGSRRRLGDPVGVASEKIAELCVTEECKKKVVMAGLLRRPSPRFGR